MSHLPPAYLLECPPRFGFGASGLGNLGRTISDTVADETLDAAWNAGYRYFDTSPLYGYGLSELRTGRYLRERERSEFVVSTKVGRYLVPPNGRSFDKGLWSPPLDLMPVLDYGYDATMRSLEQSHSRLGLGAIDIVYIHDIDRRTHRTEFERRYSEAVSGAYRALAELRAGGFVRAIGIGVNEADVAANFMADVDIDLVMLAGRYTLLDHSAMELCLPRAMEKKVGVVAVGIFNSGILAKGAVAGATYDYGVAPEHILKHVRHLEQICLENGVPLAAAAAQFPLSHPAVVGTVIGMSRPENVHRTITLQNLSIPKQFWSDLKSADLLANNVPVPA